MDYYISRYTVTKLDNALNSYKRRILMDFHKINNLKISYKEFENQFLGAKSDFKERYNEDRCYAYVWDKDKEGNNIQKPTGIHPDCIDAARYALMMQLVNPNRNKYAIR